MLSASLRLKGGLHVILLILSVLVGHIELDTTCHTPVNTTSLPQTPISNVPYQSPTLPTVLDNDTYQFGWLYEYITDTFTDSNRTHSLVLLSRKLGDRFIGLCQLEC